MNKSLILKRVYLLFKLRDTFGRDMFEITNSGGKLGDVRVLYLYLYTRLTRILSICRKIISSIGNLSAPIDSEIFKRTLLYIEKDLEADNKLIDTVKELHGKGMDLKVLGGVNDE